MMDWFLENFTKCDTPRGTLGSGPVLGRYARLDELTSGELARGTDSPLRVFEPLAPLPWYYRNQTAVTFWAAFTMFLIVLVGWIYAAET